MTTFRRHLKTFCFQSMLLGWQYSYTSILRWNWVRLA